MVCDGGADTHVHTCTHNTQVLPSGETVNLQTIVGSNMRDPFTREVRFVFLVWCGGHHREGLGTHVRTLVPNWALLFAFFILHHPCVRAFLAVWWWPLAVGGHEHSGVQSLGSPSVR